MTTMDDVLAPYVRYEQDRPVPRLIVDLAATLSWVAGRNLSASRHGHHRHSGKARTDY